MYILPRSWLTVNSNYQTSNLDLPIEIWNKILNKLDFRFQINLTSICNYFRKNLFILDLFNIDRKYLLKLTNDILKQKIFMNVHKLKILWSSDSDVSFLKKLKILHVYGNKIDQKGIDGLDLIEL